MRIEDIEIKPNNKKKKKKNWDINEWRKEYPVDYFNLSAMLVKPDEAILRDEVFKALYKSIRLYIPDTVYKYYSLDVSEKRDEENLDTLYKGKVYMSEIKGFNDPFDGRVYRSGESEYLINGNPCRLKEVSDLFYDTGIGKEGYSIIGQG